MSDQHEGGGAVTNLEEMFSSSGFAEARTPRRWRRGATARESQQRDNASAVAVPDVDDEIRVGHPTRQLAVAATSCVATGALLLVALTSGPAASGGGENTTHAAPGAADGHGAGGRGNVPSAGRGRAGVPVAAGGTSGTKALLTGRAAPTTSGPAHLGSRPPVTGAPAQWMPAGSAASGGSAPAPAPPPLPSGPAPVPPVSGLGGAGSGVGQTVTTVGTTVNATVNQLVSAVPATAPVGSAASGLGATVNALGQSFNG